jgi:hypothetical protein
MPPDCLSLPIRRQPTTRNIFIGRARLRRGPVTSEPGLATVPPEQLALPEQPTGAAQSVEPAPAPAEPEVKAEETPVVPTEG